MSDGVNGKIKCHNKRCAFEFFPRYMTASVSTRCPKCGYPIQLPDNFCFNSEVIKNWCRCYSFITEGGI
ncbi:MAG: hypothetical protein HFJ33_06360 [Clostridia bacterium]|nr:hypothetical protein [Clostridia bacterium]